jgi:hypothetical protein
MEAWVAWATVGNTVVALASAVVATFALKVAKRSASADERLTALAEAEAQRYDPPWEVEPAGGSRYLLLNDGREDAYDVHIEGDSVIRNPVPPQWDRVGQGETVEFVAATSLDQADSTVTVHWARQPGGEEHTHRRALP